MNEKTEKLLLRISIAVVAAFVVAACIVSLIKRNQKSSGFVAPDFDSGCVATDFESAPGNKIAVTEGLTVAIPSEISGNQDGIDVNFAAAPNNRGNIKLELIDSEGNIVAESGLIRPGEGLATITKIYSKNLPESDGNLTIKVLTYEPETYISLGSCTLKVHFTRK